MLSVCVNMKIHNYLPIIFSAVLGTLSCMCLDWSAWLGFIFLIPIIVHIAHGGKLSLLTGFVWGGVFFSLHFIALAEVLLFKGHGSLRILGYVFLVLYMSCYGALWHGIYGYILNKFNIQNTRVRTALFVLIGCGYFYCIFYESFFIFSVRSGYCFGLPLVSLCRYQSLLVMYLCGYYMIATTLMLCANGFLGILWHQKQYGAVLAVLVSIIIMVALPFGLKGPDVEKMNAIGFCAPSKKQTMWRSVHKTVKKLSCLFERHPHLETVVMPESSFEWIIEEHPECIECITQNCLQSSRQLVFGSFRKTAYGVGNNILFAKQEGISDYYDKKTPMVFTEVIPWPWKKIGWIYELFLSGKKELCTSTSTIHSPTNVRAYKLTNQLNVEPFICSDLFFNTQQRGMLTTPVLFIVNDSWFACTYYRRLMFCYSQMISYSWNRDVLYVCYDGAYWISRGSQITKLAD